jgi:hypothetical protein
VELPPQRQYFLLKCKPTDPNIFGSIYRKVIGAVEKGESAIGKGKNIIDKAVKQVIKPQVKLLGGAVNNVIKPGKQAHGGHAAHHHRHHTPTHHRHHRHHRQHRRDLEDNEELSQRDIDAEELFGREYDDILVERDDLD